MTEIIGVYGGYRRTFSFGFACLIYHATEVFCERNYSYKNDALGKTVGQMIGAARSARQNIVEGSSRAGTSKETELRLYDVAKGSLEEPAGSYKWFEGNLFEVSDKAIEFIKEKLDLRIGGHTLGAQSDDTFEIDEKVVAEMINNGIAHRDYTSSATVQVELFRDRLTVFSPGPMHRDMKFEMLSEDHQSYATNPIIAHALFYVKYIEEIGSGIVDMFDLCKATGLRPPEFDIDARHFTVTVYRPEFDEHGNRISASGEEVRVKAAEVGVKNPEVGVKTAEVGPYPEQIGPKAITKARKAITNTAEPITITHEPITISWCPENEKALSGSRKDLRERAKVIWEHLAENPDLTVRELSFRLRYSLAATQGAINALKECGLLVKIGQTKGSKWVVKTLANDTEVVG